MACCTIPLNPNIVHISTMKSEFKEIAHHGKIAVSIARNRCDVLISKEIWANDASAVQTAPNSYSLRVVFQRPKYGNFATHH